MSLCAPYIAGRAPCLLRSNRGSGSAHLPRAYRVDQLINRLGTFSHAAPKLFKRADHAFKPGETRTYVHTVNICNAVEMFLHICINYINDEHVLRHLLLVLAVRLGNDVHGNFNFRARDL